MELQTKVFQPSAEYDAWVRLSNASGTVQADAKKDLRSIAVRVFYDNDNKERVQDLLLTNAEVPHTANARDALIATRALASRWKVVALLKLLFGLGFPKTWHALKTASRPVRSLAAEQFWSRTPYAVGPEKVAIKFKLTPRNPEPVVYKARLASTVPPGDYLRGDLAERLKGGDVSFDFQVQRYIDEAATPIEDAFVRWRSEFEPAIAQLILPSQYVNVNTPEAVEHFIDQQAFNPWNTTEDFRPIGSLNRVRKLVYGASADLRQARRTYNHDNRNLVVKWLEKLLGRLLLILNARRPWHRWTGYQWSRCLGLAMLAAIRNRARETNLVDTTCTKDVIPVGDSLRQVDPSVIEARTADGSDNDLLEPEMGRANTRFGRNIHTEDDDPRLFHPHPRKVSRVLMMRDKFIEIPTLNLLAAAWIQFQVHGWFNHDKKKWKDAAKKDLIFIPSDDQSEWHPQAMPVVRTTVDKCKASSEERDTLPAYISTETHWWDASQLYGSSLRRQKAVRAGSHGKLSIVNGRLPEDPELPGVDLTGFNDNWWLGLSLIHTLFALEHNAICDHLRQMYTGWDDEKLFNTSRLINAALMAKIHTLEWSTAMLTHPTLDIAFNTYWWGLASQQVCKLFARMATPEIAHGLPGSATDHYGVPYAMTEEFVAVYRMHPLLLDEFVFWSLNGARLGKHTLPEMIGKHTRTVLDRVPATDVFYSFGISHPGALTLHNYPTSLRQHVRDTGQELDLAAVDVLRDRERHLPRYNDFRKALHLRPVKSFEKLCANKEWMKQLQDVYEDRIDDVDLMVGMLAETPPEGFGFSETAFRIFIVMAARRIQSDRFFTTHYTPDVYTPSGLDWINENDMRTVLTRHYPALARALDGVNPFKPWKYLHSA